MIDAREAEPQSRAPPEEPALEIPADHRCAQCGYPSGASGSVVCPECGWRTTRLELDARLRRQDIVARWREEERSRLGALGAVIIGVYGLGVGVLSKSVEIGVLSALATCCLVLLTWWMGDWAVFRCGRHRREYLGVLWARGLWMLHLPWLVSPAFVAAALAVGLVDVWANDPAGGVYTRIVAIGFWMWVVGCAIAFLAWWQKRRCDVAAGGYLLGRADAVAFVLGAAVTLASMAAGFGAGVLTALSVAEWLELQDFLWG